MTNAVDLGSDPCNQGSSIGRRACRSLHTMPRDWRKYSLDIFRNHVIPPGHDSHSAGSTRERHAAPRRQTHPELSGFAGV